MRCHVPAGFACCVLTLVLAACANPTTQPRTNSPEPQPQGPVQRPEIELRPSYQPGQRFRTTRILRVEELTESERYYTEAEEVTLTEVQRVDDAGRLLAVRRAWETSATRLAKGYGRGELARGDLEGCTLELTQKATGVQARVVSGNPNVAGASFIIEGFDAAVLPLDPVREGDIWELEGTRLMGLSRFIEAMEFKIEKNKLVCRLIEVSPGVATISLDWRISGELRNVAAVLEFKGELLFDRKAGLIAQFKLSGGREGRGAKQQIDIEITRRNVRGWLDLER
jgi:hypothetical protein